MFFLINIKNILVENTNNDNYVKYHWALVDLGRWSDQCKPPARFLLGWTSALEIKISYLLVFLMIRSHHLLV